MQKGGDSRVSHGGSGIGGLSDGRGGIGGVSLQATALGGLQGDGDSLAAAMPSLSPDPMGGEAAAYTVTIGGEEAFGAGLVKDADDHLFLHVYECS